jgi:hypothetical protein
MHTLIAGCLVAAVGPAAATATSSAITSNLTITLSDLNPTDSTTPWLTYAPSKPGGVHTDAVAWGDTFQNYSKDDYVPKPKQDGVLTSELKSDWSMGSGTLTAAANAAGFTAMSSQGTANSGLDGYGAYRNTVFNGSGGDNFFMLSPMTTVTFSLTADLKAFTSMGYNLDSDMGEFAHARTLLNVGGKVNGVDQYIAQEEAVWAYYYVNDDNTVSGVSESWSGTLSVTFYNYGDTATQVMLQAYAATEGQSAVWDGVTPVPEPETYAMLLAGLALVGWTGHRNKARGRA